MTELAAFGTPGFLPLRVRLAQQAEERAEAQEARDAERDLAARVEQRRSNDLELYRRQCEERGEYVSPIDMAIGRVTRPAGDALTTAAAQWAADDDRADATARQANGEKLNLIGELEPPSTRSRPAMTTTRRAIERRSEAFRASVSAQREAEARRAELENRVPAVREPHWAAGRRRSTSRRSGGYRGMSYR